MMDVSKMAVRNWRLAQARDSGLTYRELSAMFGISMVRCRAVYEGREAERRRLIRRAEDALDVVVHRLRQLEGKEDPLAGTPLEQMPAPHPWWTQPEPEWRGYMAMATRVQNRVVAWSRQYPRDNRYPHY